MLLLGLLINLSLFARIYGFYVPGVAPVEFRDGDPIEVKAVKMTSTRTQLPYDYYSLPLCTPKNGTVYKSENLGTRIKIPMYFNLIPNSEGNYFIYFLSGEVLRGDRIVNTPYEVRMTENVACKILCSKKWSLNEQNIVMNRITHDYNVHL